MIKRPVLDIGGKLLVGFQAEQYARRRCAAARSSSVPIFATRSRVGKLARGIR